MVSKIVFSAAAAYIVIGVILGGILGYVMPAVNLKGEAYYAATWPAQISAQVFHTPAPPIGAWAFTFKDR